MSWTRVNVLLFINFIGTLYAASYVIHRLKPFGNSWWVLPTFLVLLMWIVVSAIALVSGLDVASKSLDDNNDVDGKEEKHNEAPDQHP